MDKLYDGMQLKKKELQVISSYCGILWNFPSAQWRDVGREDLESTIYRNRPKSVLLIDNASIE